MAPTLFLKNLSTLKSGNNSKIALIPPNTGPNPSSIFPIISLTKTPVN